jgi:hypothetical protein
MPGRSNRDDKQAEPGTFGGFMHQLGQSLHLVPKDTDDATPAPAPAAAKPSSALPVLDTAKDRGQQIDKTVEDDSK